ncbi:cystatin domain-containing protein [Caerostris extrusa]|uniref:Cystatin domain-containing protein n=1 Tax=Caerostris extrusa TaxID=172846 RepID=A0AAV4Y1G9_CAEEX|nr:cystatin domain-containing protein [Caerostris extrusa]
MPKVGGVGDLREPDENVHQITRQVKDEVQAKTGLLFEEFVPVNYRSQLVNGTNYFIKVKHAPTQHLHLRVHRSFAGEVTLSAFQLDKKLDDELEYFQ